MVNDNTTTVVNSFVADSSVDYIIKCFFFSDVHNNKIDEFYAVNLCVNTRLLVRVTAARHAVCKYSNISLFYIF